MSVAVTHGSLNDIRHSSRHPWIAKLNINRPSMTVVREEPTPPTTERHPTDMKRISARNLDGLIIFSGIDQDSGMSNAQQAAIDDTKTAHCLQAHHNSSNVPNVALSFVESRSASPETMQDEPNANGTYSREYTLRYPDISWIHRGQGRYRPEKSVSDRSQDTTTASQDQKLLFTEVRKSLRTRLTDASEDHVESRSNARHLSPRAARLAEPTNALHRRQSDQGMSAAELREARLSRRSLPFTTSGGSQSTETAGEDDANKTYTKTYVEAHPEMHFRHRGNGFYKRISPAQSDAVASVVRRTSARSLTKSETSPFESRSHTIHSSELKNFPGEKFKHRGNGYYRRESVVSQNTSTSSAAITERSVSPLDMAEMLTKDEMLVVKAIHPHVRFIHRGNGRYRRADPVAHEIGTASTTHAYSRATFDKEYVRSHPEEILQHLDYGRYKRSSREARPAISANDENSNELFSGLVTKKYVQEHPELVFHHRGQGRWASGPRPSAISSSKSPLEEEPKLVDRDYVDAHPEENFHHRGQGRWARGLPPPGSSNKMAVRGPGAQEQRETVPARPETHSADKCTEMPGLLDLVRREDGPAAYPQLQWHYRGGGKWARLSRGEADAYERSARARQRAKPVMVASQISSQLDHQGGTEERASGRRSGSTQTLAPPTLKRKHSALQSSENNDIEQQSEDSTPRPRILTLEEDQLCDDDLPELYRNQWSPPAAQEDNDEAAQIMRQNFRPLSDGEAFIRSLTKINVSSRPTENLYRIAAHVQKALQMMQDEYLELDRITAPHARIPRKAAMGGRLPVEPQVFEDRKEADLYDYQFDPKKVGYQDPEAQKISRDVDVRELRKRRKHGELDADSSLAEPLPRRVIKPVERFEGVPGSTSRRSRFADASKQGSVTPDRFGTPEKAKTTPELQAWAENYVAPRSGRWANHIPKRIKELRGGSAGPTRPDVLEDLTTSGDEDELSTSTKTTPTRIASNVVDSIEDEMEVDDTLIGRL